MLYCFFKSLDFFLLLNACAENCVRSEPLAVKIGRVPEDGGPAHKFIYSKHIQQRRIVCVHGTATGECIGICIWYILVSHTTIVCALQLSYSIELLHEPLVFVVNNATLALHDSIHIHSRNIRRFIPTCSNRRGACAYYKGIQSRRCRARWQASNDRHSKYPSDSTRILLIKLIRSRAYIIYTRARAYFNRGVLFFSTEKVGLQKKPTLSERQRLRRSSYCCNRSNEIPIWRNRKSRDSLVSHTSCVCTDGMGGDGFPIRL